MRTPQARYVGKIAQAFDRLQRYGMEGVLDGIAKFIQVTGDTSIARRMKPWQVLRFLWDCSGAPTKCVMSASENAAFEEAEQQKEDQARQAALLEQLSNAGKNNAAAAQQNGLQ